MRFIYKIKASLIIFVFLVVNKSGFTQYQYSIDLKTQKSRHVPLSYQVNQLKENYTDYRALKNKRREVEKLSNRTRRHTYSIQQHEVKQRMKRSRREAEYFNQGKVPFSIKLKKLFEWTM